eukprot:CAMPEP_0194145822 /NCGR_PEP_ID=MMETSP0152-20130528/18853_1 /TAXON_ID=1049557 /ORGANISM="Thalassiothrix antarctica, Strain L6-D1" /LENGTH=244 /DNA_ID=CAMNT_0038846169 /DNA_START=28 /DNA_END=762 /DNA_ORIENTATION=-
MADNKLRCVVVLRIESSGSTVIAKYDHAAQYETHGGTGSSSLYGDRDKDFADAIQDAVSKDPPGVGGSGFGGFKVVQSDIHQLVYGTNESGICVAVITGLRYPSRIAIKMLQELYTHFIDRFGGDAAMAPTNSLTKKSKELLSGQCKKFEDPSNVDKAQRVLGQVDAVKGQMQDNIAGMLKNTEKAETLAEKSDQLNEQANVFKKKAVDLKKQMKWKNLKMTLILVGVVVGLILIIVLPMILKK